MTDTLYTRVAQVIEESLARTKKILDDDRNISFVQGAFKRAIGKMIALMMEAEGVHEVFRAPII